VLERVDTALSRGEIDYSSAARQKLYYLFVRGSMDPRWSKGDLRPARCGTLVLEELRKNLDRLDPETRALYERYTLRATGSRLTTQAALVYETTHFHIEYTTSGQGGVPPADVNPANGVPTSRSRRPAAGRWET